MAGPEAYQTLVGEGKVAHNLVYNPTTGEWELEQQSVLEAVTANLYVALDDVESLLTSMDTTLTTISGDVAAGHETYKLSDFDTASDPMYVGYLDKDGNWIIEEYNIASGTTRYTSGSSGYTTAWTGRAGLSYDYFDTEF